MVLFGLWFLVYFFFTVQKVKQTLITMKQIKLFVNFFFFTNDSIPKSCIVLTCNFMFIEFYQLFWVFSEFIVMGVSSSRSITLGESYLSVTSCEQFSRNYFRNKTNDWRPELFLQFRQNKTNKWETLIEVNKSGTFITNISKAIKTDIVRNETCDNNRYRSRCTIYANISMHLETCKDNLFPSFRCQYSDGTDTEISRDLELEIKGK